MFLIRVAVVCLALIAIAACNKQTARHQVATPSPSASPVSGPAAAVQTHTYQAVGVVKSLNPERPGIEIAHDDIDGLMPAMQMEFPVTDGSMLNGLAVDDRIDFTIEDGVGDMKVIAIKKK